MIFFPRMQPFDEGGRRIATPSALTSSIGMRLFSTLDDGTGFTPVEYILDAWMEEGIENSIEILQVLQSSHCNYECGHYSCIYRFCSLGKSGLQNLHRRIFFFIFLQMMQISKELY